MNNVGLILALDDRHIAVCLTHASRTPIKKKIEWRTGEESKYGYKGLLFEANRAKKTKLTVAIFMMPIQISLL